MALSLRWCFSGPARQSEQSGATSKTRTGLGLHLFSIYAALINTPRLPTPAKKTAGKASGVIPLLEGNSGGIDSEAIFSLRRFMKEEVMR